jgi:light-regulated signal transduction histidine kinase (bacteriophytochrome)
MTETPKDELEIKREFQELAYMIVHHLKEPVRSIRTGAELLLESRGEPSSGVEDNAPSIESCANCVLRGATRLDEIATSIAQYADDLSDENEPMEPTNTEVVMRSLRQKLQPLIDHTQTIVRIEALPKLTCQPTRISRLLEHLVRNAITYRREQVPPLIHVSAKRDSEDWLFSIADNGSGIDPLHMQDVFEPFRRLHGKAYHGLGMGLVISRRIVVRHGGRIWLDSKPGVGTTVFFTLPN